MIFRFLHPWFLVGLALLPVLYLAYKWIDARARARIVFSDVSLFKDIPPSPRVVLRHAPMAARLAALGLLAVAVARPQYGNRTQEIKSKGIDIMMVLDVSGSMREKDLEPTRLEAAKRVIQRFIDGREKGLQNDRIGLVAFSRIALTRCPLTVDYTILKKITASLDYARREFDGTAIGSGLATAVARLKDSEAKSKVVILVTDGQNNAGEYDPLTAARIAQALGVRVYTIGVVPTSSMRQISDAIFGVSFQMAASDVDETQMKQIAEMTGGKYFKAEDAKGLIKIFAEIDKLEKTEVKVKEFYRYSEAFAPWAALAFIAVLTETFISRTVLRRIP